MEADHLEAGLGPGRAARPLQPRSAMKTEGTHAALEAPSPKRLASPEPRELARPEELDDRPSRELVSELMGEAQNLIRGEVELARAELREVKALARGVGLSAGLALASAFVALLLGATTLVAIFALVLPLWAAALVAFALFSAVAAVTGVEAQGRLRRMREAPKDAVSTLREDARWLKRTLELIRTQRHPGAVS